MTRKKVPLKTVTLTDTFGKYCRISEDAVLEGARSCIDGRFSGGEELTSSEKTREYIKLMIGDFEREVFYVMWLNNRHQVIRHGILFQGTIDGSMVHPREVVKDALSCNAVAAIFAHNHPSGNSHPSEADISITRRLKNALALVDVRTLDHIVIGETVTSMAELGLV